MTTKKATKKAPSKAAKKAPRKATKPPAKPTPLYLERVTFKRAMAAHACYSAVRLRELLGRNGKTPREVALLPIHQADKVWALRHATGPACEAWDDLYRRVVRQLVSYGSCYSATHGVLVSVALDAADPDYVDSSGFGTRLPQRTERTTPIKT